ncbi:hypothetical protein [Metabacillus fastidiosus]
MKLELVNHLLEVEMTILYKEKTKIIDKFVMDTGAPILLSLLTLLMK